MKLINFPWGPYPRRLTLYLAEKGLTELDLLEVEFPHQPAKWPKDFLLNLNPAHSLPVLDLGEQLRIGQSIAILEYLEEIFPKPNLLGDSPEQRALTRELVAIFDEATKFFGIWARHGSFVNADRHVSDRQTALVGAERYAAKLRVAEAKFVGPFVAGPNISIADCVAFALLEFTAQFYGVALPADCVNLACWFQTLSDRPAMAPASYPSEMLELSLGLCEQTQIAL
ncbi:glutathione S-transferase family protein [Rhizobium brockwellii]|uniref:glutathione S-transferase family protein n=1 Tax=Rhizobium brockwellii TaxID=3019932 RepID=UPI003F9704B4